MTYEISISPRVGWRFIENEVVAFNCSNHMVAIWNRTASCLWKMISEGKPVEQLTMCLVSQYAIAAELAEQDVMRFLHETAALGVIDCPAIQKSLGEPTATDEGEDVLLSIEMLAIEHLIPFAVTFETTYACNERCVHCYMDRNCPALKLPDIKRILDQLAQSGCLFVSFTGGEFFTRKDALDIVEYAGSLHFAIDILSNGTLIDEAVIDTLGRNPVRRVQVSIYGATPETHDSITCLPGSFDNTWQGITLLRKAGIKVEIAFPLMQQNFAERHKVLDMAKSSGCGMLPSPIITARNNGSTDTFQLRITDQQLSAFLSEKELSRLYSGRKPFQEHQFYFEYESILEAPPCFSGFNTCAVTPSGKLLPCNQLMYEVGDLTKEDFSSIWRNSERLKYLRSLRISDLPECAGCSLLHSCTRCPGLALLENDDLLGPSPINCQIARMQETIAMKGGDTK